MPGADYYSDLSLPEAIRRFADYHFDPDNRHISRAEHDLLMKAASMLQAAEVTSGS